MLKAELVFDAQDIVGESLVYDDRRDALVWVDIGAKRIHRLWLADGRCELWDAPDFPTSIGLGRDGAAVVGLRDRVARWAFGGKFETLAIIEPDLPDNRLNEGRVGPDGAFWVGTMQNNLNADGSARDMDRNSGAIYRVTAQGQVTQLTPREFGIANTMAWIRDGRFLTADTLRNEIYVYDIANETLVHKRLFAGPDPRGAPDGSCLDDEDGLWNCRVAGGAGVIHYSRDGSVAGFVDLPCTWPTSCAFGGARLNELYVTSARFTMSADHLREHPEEGALFRVRPGARGRPEPRFG
jgi:sugar lactone lactonase YvrE